MKKVIWSEIDGYIKKNKQIIDSEVKEIKKKGEKVINRRGLHLFMFKLSFY